MSEAEEQAVYSVSGALATMIGEGLDLIESNKKRCSGLARR